MNEGKRPPRRPHNTFIGQIKKDAGVGNYRALIVMENDHEEWRRVANQPMG